MRKINEIIVHCSATAEGRDYTFGGAYPDFRANDRDRCRSKVSVFFFNLKLTYYKVFDTVRRSEHKVFGSVVRRIPRNVRASSQDARHRI